MISARGNQKRDMASHVRYDLAPPRSWDQFKELCADTFAAEWRDPNLVRYGRSGQAQHGVDIVAADGSRWPVGLQFKKKSVWPVSKVSPADLDAEVEKVKAFTPALKTFYLVSSAPNDAKLDKRARQLAEAHRKTGLFGVVVIGWGELVRRATLHRNVALKHFGALDPTPRHHCWQLGQEQGKASRLLKKWLARRRPVWRTVQLC